MEITGDHRILPSPLPAGRVAIDAVRSALIAAEAVGAARGRSHRLGSDTAWIEDSFDSLRHLRVDGRAPVSFSAYSGFFETGDGWIRTHGNYPHHRDALLMACGLSAEADAVDLRAVLRRGSATDLSEKITYSGGIATRVLTVDEWLGHPGIGVPRRGARVRTRERGAVAVARSRGRDERTSDDPWRDEAPGEAGSSLPLAGLRVVSFTRVIAGPVAARLLAALGAKVIRIDPPHMPELESQHLDTDGGVHVRTADMRRSADRTAVHRLLADADGLLVGYRPDSMDRHGLGLDAIRASHPHLAAVMIRAWDPLGEWGRRRGFDSIVQAASGVAWECGADGRPGTLPAQVLDHTTGYRAAAALLHMWAHGEAGVREFALSDVGAELLGIPAMTAGGRLVAADARTHPFTGPSLVTGDTVSTSDSREGGSDGAAREPHTEEVQSAHGVLRRVPPPVAVDGTRLRCPSPPDSRRALRR
ncbi:CoA transferase [Brevibacterium jeotgali]|uniref:CoA-transferase family III n=1 Tax=Brevibacterium jeotgali TaxID=1262550 RepID=A0A2H1L0P1_9MICO|nr:CoA transferase [Brevibacterium jeotgali]TWC02164.1 CoA transferase family III [Brevibacterium jeotgali]SMY10486.1 CoA-transferase family III [Brevibacterium jeotgali]